MLPLFGPQTPEVPPQDSEPPSAAEAAARILAGAPSSTAPKTPLGPAFSSDAGKPLTGYTKEDLAKKLNPRLEARRQKASMKKQESESESTGLGPSSSEPDAGSHFGGGVGAVGVAAAKENRDLGPGVAGNS